MKFPFNRNIKSALIHSTIVFVFAVLLYLPSVFAPFVNDEIAFIQRNKIESVSQIGGLFDKKEYDGYYYRPLPNAVSGLITLAFDYDYHYYRIFNLLLHAAVSVLVFYLIFFFMQNVKGRENIALFAALFFAAFPLHDFAVIWHTDLFDRMMALFYLAALVKFVIDDYRNSFLSLLFFILSLLSKEMAFSFPIIIFLLYFFFGKEKNNFKISLKKCAPYLIVAAGFILFRLAAFNNNIFEAKDAHSTATIFDALKNYIFFGGLLVFPFFIREIQSFVLTHKIIFIFGSIAAFLPLLFLLIKNRKKNLIAVFLILFILITIAPASRLLMRWYLYLPSAGFTALLAYIIFTSKFKRKYMPVAIALMLLTIYSAALLHKESKWVKYTNQADQIMKETVAQHKGDFLKDTTIGFLTVPAKVDDIPIFQLGFDHLLNYYMKGMLRAEIHVYTKSYLSCLNDEISEQKNNGEYSLIQEKDNHFILSDYEKNIKLVNKNYKNGKVVALTLSNNKEWNKILFTFSNGKFIKIKGFKE